MEVEVQAKNYKETGIGATYKVSTHVDLRADLDYVNGIGKSNATGEMSNTILFIGAVYSF